MTYGRETFEASDCADVVADIRALPPADPVTCAPDEHFFIRHDGWVAGCHLDCATAADCSCRQARAVGRVALGCADASFAHALRTSRLNWSKSYWTPPSTLLHWAVREAFAGLVSETCTDSLHPSPSGDAGFLAPRQ
jgi:hypothetical protein